MGNGKQVMDKKKATVMALEHFDTAQLSVLDNFIAVWSSAYLLTDIGMSLSCKEANALAKLLKVFGEEDAAEGLLDAHCLGDEDGDNAAHRRRAKKLLDS